MFSETTFKLRDACKTSVVLITLFPPRIFLLQLLYILLLDKKKNRSVTCPIEAKPNRV